MYTKGLDSFKGRLEREGYQTVYGDILSASPLHSWILLHLKKDYVGLILWVATADKIPELFFEEHANEIDELNDLFANCVDDTYKSVCLSQEGFLQQKQMEELASIFEDDIKWFPPEMEDFLDDKCLCGYDKERYEAAMLNWSKDIRSAIINHVPDGNDLYEVMMQYQTSVVIQELNGMAVRLIRERMNMTQKQFADKFQIPVGTLSHWEQGVRNPPSYVCYMLKMIEDLQNALPEDSVNSVIKAVLKERGITQIGVCIEVRMGMNTIDSMTEPIVLKSVMSSDMALSRYAGHKVVSHEIVSLEGSDKEWLSLVIE